MSKDANIVPSGMISVSIFVNKSPVSRMHQRLIRHKRTRRGGRRHKRICPYQGTANCNQQQNCAVQTESIKENNKKLVITGHWRWDTLTNIYTLYLTTAHASTARTAFTSHHPTINAYESHPKNTEEKRLHFFIWCQIAPPKPSSSGILMLWRIGGTGSLDGDGAPPSTWPHLALDRAPKIAVLPTSMCVGVPITKMVDGVYVLGPAHAPPRVTRRIT
ncbi:uncharacterized protein LOC130275445 [Hyla sarda]|uniref:uncharacterized protein LOC130275445 n=1 Tax=Hyla sarda TaxID=327740 RepID=UPI0024C3C0BC|nr:uncharacterized protein LOC130275445 [Hyla sarda]